MLEITRTGGNATITLTNGRVNALRHDVIDRLNDAFDEVERDGDVSSVVLTGAGPFFSFGFDVPHFLGVTRNEFTAFLVAFNAFYTRLFLFPKPLVAAINGHAVAGGWMLAQPCDARVIAKGNVKLGLNEVRFGAALFSGSAAILQHLAGGRIADQIMGSGDFFDEDFALAAGLADLLCERDELAAATAALIDWRFGAVMQPSFGQIKRVSRGPMVEAWQAREPATIERFVAIWYRDDVQAELAKILIR